MSRVLVLLLCLMAACGGQTEIDYQAEAKLAQQVQDIRTSAARYDRQAAEQKLAELRETVNELRRDNELSESRRTNILAAADEVDRYLQLIVAPSRPRVRSRPSPTAPRPSPTPSVQVTPDDAPPSPPLPDATSGAPGEPGGNPGNGQGGQTDAPPPQE